MTKKRAAVKKKSVPKSWWWIGLILLFCGIGIREYLTRQWRGGERFTVLTLGSDGAVIESWDYESRLGLRLILPANLEIETIEGRGRWRVGVLPDMARKYSLKWVEESIEENLGIYVTITKSDNRKWWLGNGWDSGVWWRQLRNINWTVLDAEKLRGVDVVKQADGAEVLRVGKEWKLGIGDSLAYSGIVREAKSVTVVNTTTAAGLGAHVAGNLEISGFKVDAVASREEEEDDCILRGREADVESISGKWLIKSFKCLKSVDESLTDGRLELILGRKYQNRLEGDGINS